MSNEVHFIVPILISIMVAKSVADATTHDLYHGILDVKCVPFLPPEPEGNSAAMDMHSVEEIMHHAPIVTLNEIVRFHPQVQVRLNGL